MDAYVMGNIVGRLVTSYSLVLLVYLVFNKFKWQIAFSKINGWVGVPIVLVVFVLGLLASAL